MEKMKQLQSIEGFDKLSDVQKMLFNIMHSNVSTGGCLIFTSNPGLGKTKIIENMNDILNFQYIDIRLPQKDETEVGLFPVVMKDEDGNPSYVKELPPHWALMANEKPTIVAFEELNRARREIQNGALQILMERRIGHDFKFNDNVYFIATSNLDDSYTEELSDAMKGRLVHIPFQFKYSEWKENWANDNIHPLFLKWLDKNPEHLLEKPKDDQIAYCSPRSIERFSSTFGYFVEWDNPDIQKAINVVREMGNYMIGNLSNDFLEFLKKYARINADDVLNKYEDVESQFETLDRSNTISIVEDLKTIFTNGNSYTEAQHKNVIKFLKHEITGGKLVEDDIRVGFLKYFVETLNIPKLKKVEHFDSNNKLYIQAFSNEIDILFGEDIATEDYVGMFNKIANLERVVSKDNNMNSGSNMFTPVSGVTGYYGSSANRKQGDGTFGRENITRKSNINMNGIESSEEEKKSKKKSMWDALIGQ